MCLLSSCAASHTKQLLADPPQDLSRVARINDVPLYVQQNFYCGPAVLASALNVYGIDVDPATLVNDVYLPGLRGSLQLEMLGATRKYGLIAYRITPSLLALLREIDQGHPVIVLQNLGLKIIPQWHYSVVVGYDIDAKEIILHTGLPNEYRVSLRTFEHTWARAFYWALVPLPGDTLPVVIDSLQAVKAIAAVERLGNIDVAHQAYKLAAERWPDNLIAYMGLGNTYYANNDVNGAMRSFLQATEIGPESAAAYNNLAVSLAELGCRKDALLAAQCAVNISGEDNETYTSTLHEVSKNEHMLNSTFDCPKVECQHQTPLE